MRFLATRLSVADGQSLGRKALASPGGLPQNLCNPTEFPERPTSVFAESPPGRLMGIRGSVIAQNARYRASRVRALPKNFSQLTPLRTTISMFNAISSKNRAFRAATLNVA